MPPKRNKQTYYNEEWEDASKYPTLVDWICEGKDDTVFSCKVCRSYNKKLGRMGVGAPNNHMKELNESGEKTKHQRIIEDVRQSRKITEPSFSGEKEQETVDPSSGEKNETVQTPGQHFFKAKESAEAEILLAMKVVTAHLSLRSIDDFGDLLRKMDRNSVVARDFQMKRKKAAYVIKIS